MGDIMKVNTYKDILEEYVYFIEDMITIGITYWLLNYQSKIVFEDNDSLREIFRNEIKKYVSSYLKEIKIYNFLLKNERKLYAEDIYRILDDFVDEYEIKCNYLEEIFTSLETAIGMELEHRFYIPSKKPKYLTDEDIIRYKKIAVGYSYERIIEFLLEEEIYELDTIDEQKREIKQIDVDPLENMELFGLFDNGHVLIPKVKDELSTLIGIHELVHKSLVLNKELIGNDSIVYGEDLPIFYELLFQNANAFSKEKIHTTDIALELLRTYKEEPFMEQVEKAKKLINK